MREEGGDVLVNIGKVLLLLVNMAFMVAGCLLVYFSQRVKSVGWVEVFEGDFQWVGDSAFLFMLVAGAVVISLAAIGCLGAWLRNRMLLLVYSIVLVITAGLFIVVAIGGHSAKSTAQEWKDASYPANDKEPSVGQNFNKLYCYSQMTYYCAANAAEVVKLLGMTSTSSLLSTFTVQDICASSYKPSDLDQLCELCAVLDKYDDYKPVQEWTDTSCPRTAANQAWCGAFFVSGEPGEVFANASPYSGCRSALFDLILKYSNMLFFAGIVVCLATVLMLAFACLLRRSANRPYVDDSFVVDTPSP
ncbi:hypothetical protein Poli38472_004161 [Pythium oligandrum]|uniref:Tetraspanin n=1 Tax=Pythium oligandrum TaxID=41045 RepID=A0A8K1CMK2_PYTOL|nr:hypothetical protein Poli38472_004161 [Pythium oligandrum]|eukprot:TMW66396.1 hypothetical protein Poli38472_004161 [Pythium oligandrum]